MYPNQLLDINIHFLCRSNHKYKNGNSPIALRITYRSQRREILTGLSCDKNYWAGSTQQVDPRFKGGAALNKELYIIYHKVMERFQELKYAGQDFTIDELIDKIKGKETPPQTLVEYMNLTIKELQERVKIDLAITTFFKYKRTIRYIDEFLIVRKGVKNIAASNVNPDFLNQLFLFLRKQKNQSHNSAVALMNCLKTILRSAVKKGAINKNPFDNFSLTQKPVSRGYLELDEIKKLQQVQGLNKEQEFKRDLFLLACFTGIVSSPELRPFKS